MLFSGRLAWVGQSPLTGSSGMDQEERLQAALADRYLSGHGRAHFNSFRPESLRWIDPTRMPGRDRACRYGDQEQSQHGDGEYRRIKW